MSDEIKAAKQFVDTLLKEQFKNTPTSPTTTRELLFIQAQLLQVEQIERIADLVVRYADQYIDLS